MTKEFIKNVLPDFKTSIVYKSVKEGQTTFRITQQLLQSVYLKAQKLKNIAVIVLSIPANKDENYIIKCHITKEKK